MGTSGLGRRGGAWGEAPAAEARGFGAGGRARPSPPSRLWRCWGGGGGQVSFPRVSREVSFPALPGLGGLKGGCVCVFFSPPYRSRRVLASGGGLVFFPQLASGGLRFPSLLSFEEMADSPRFSELGGRFCAPFLPPPPPTSAMRSQQPLGVSGPWAARFPRGTGSGLGPMCSPLGWKLQPVLPGQGLGHTDARGGEFTATPGIPGGSPGEHRQCVVADSLLVPAVEVFGAGYGESEQLGRGSSPEDQRGGDAEVVLGFGGSKRGSFHVAPAAPHLGVMERVPTCLCD